MNLTDLLENAGGSESINNLAAQLGLDRKSGSGHRAADAASRSRLL